MREEVDADCCGGVVGGASVAGGAGVGEPAGRFYGDRHGGVKDSGLGREGLRWAIEDMTEVRIMVLAWPS